MNYERKHIAKIVKSKVKLKPKRVSQSSLQQIKSKKTRLQKSITRNKTHSSHNKSNINALTNKCLSLGFNKKARREINNFYTITFVVHKIFFATKI